MCLVEVYLLQDAEGSASDEPVLTDVAYIDIADNEIVLQQLFGEVQTVKGVIRSIDLAKNRVLIEPMEDQASDDGRLSAGAGSLSADH